MQMPSRIGSLPRARVRRKPKASVVRLHTVSTDQLVLCPDCGFPMRLSEKQTFECKQCGHAFTADQAIEVLKKDNE